MEQYASKEDTIKTLLELGFVKDKYVLDSFNSIRTEVNVNTGHRLPVVNLCIRKTPDDYYCVIVGSWEWSMPVVWKGPEAVWACKNPTDEFVNYLNKYYPGWR